MGYVSSLNSSHCGRIHSDHHGDAGMLSSFRHHLHDCAAVSTRILGDPKW